MPGKVKVKILAGRNLPVMDRASDTTDAYVEVKLGTVTYKTDVYRKSLNPYWNSEWFRFEVDDLELQDEPLQIRLMDHDTYSANDAIGKVYIDLNPLLVPYYNYQTVGEFQTGSSTMSGWLPVYDTIHGIRGEVNVVVRVDLFSDFNKFRQSSCGVQFFFTPEIPHGYHCQNILGFVEELVVNDDPEYQWIDKIRTPRASNEARQTLFSKLSGELQRRIGLKVLELGGNAVIGYRLCFDLEGESGIVVRGVGSAVVLIHQHIGASLVRASTYSCRSPSPLREPCYNPRDCSEHYLLRNSSGPLLFMKSFSDNFSYPIRCKSYLSLKNTASDASNSDSKNYKIKDASVSFLKKIIGPESFFFSTYNEKVKKSIPVSVGETLVDKKLQLNSFPSNAATYSKLPEEPLSKTMINLNDKTRVSKFDMNDLNSITAQFSRFNSKRRSLSDPLLNNSFNKIFAFSGASLDKEALSHSNEREFSSTFQIFDQKKVSSNSHSSHKKGIQPFLFESDVDSLSESASDSPFNCKKFGLGPPEINFIPSTPVSCRLKQSDKKLLDCANVTETTNSVNVEPVLMPCVSQFSNVSRMHCRDIACKDPVSYPFCDSSYLEESSVMLSSPKKGIRSRHSSGCYSVSRSPLPPDDAKGDFVAAIDSNHPTNASPTHSGKAILSPVRTASGAVQRTSESDLSATPRCGSYTGSGGSSGGKGGTVFQFCDRPVLTQESFEMLEFPFLTMKKFPPGFILHIGGTVSARSVKLLDRGHAPEEVENRDNWWTQIRSEIRSHTRALSCNVVLGYEEFTTICDDVCILNASGTVAVVTSSYHDIYNYSTQIHNVPFERKDSESHYCPTVHPSSTDNSESNHVVQASSKGSHTVINRCTTDDCFSIDGSVSMHQTNLNIPKSLTSLCSMCHIPYSEQYAPFKVKISKCAICRKGKVADILLTTLELPPGISITGKGCLIQARVARSRKELKGELNAKDISEALPFLEYELHKQLVNKMKVKGMNSLFGLRVRVTLGERLLVGIGTATAVYLSALPMPPVPKVVSGDIGSEEGRKLADAQKQLQEIISNFDEDDIDGISSSSSEDEFVENEFSLGNRNVCFMELDDLEDAEMTDLLSEGCPSKYVQSVTTQMPPGLPPDQIVTNLQMFIRIWRAKIPNEQIPFKFAHHIDLLFQSVYFKIRNLSPCIISGLTLDVELPEEDEIQFTLLGMVTGLGQPSEKGSLNLVNGVCNGSQETADLNEDGKICPSDKMSSSILKDSTGQKNSLYAFHQPPKKDHFGIEITPLSHIPGAHIDRYLGNLNFFFIRESTSIKESGGISGFMGSFVNEVLAIIRAHIGALGGNAMTAFFLSECILLHYPNRNQAQCLINVGGDVVFVSYGHSSHISD